MTRRHRHIASTTLPLPAAAFLLLVALPGSMIAQGLPADYARAEAIATAFDGLAIGFPDDPNWIDGTHVLWYRVSTEGGYRFVRVDADAAEKAPAFDHARLAASLSAAAGESYTAVTLPFSSFRPIGKFEAIEFEAEGRTWRCTVSDYRCAQTEAPRGSGSGGGATSERQPETVLSPDGRWEALVRDHDAAIRRIGSAEITALSYDGTDGDAYQFGTFSWSPDSRKLAAYRVRPAVRRLLHYVESSPEDQIQPRFFTSVGRQNPGDVLEVKTPVLFDIETGTQVVVNRTLFPDAYDQTALRWWEDSRALTFEYYQRGGGVYRIIEIDGATGVARALLDERPATVFRYSTLYSYYSENGEEIIWASTRDGWRHLYLHDGRTGEVKNQITHGEWAVHGVDFVDEANRQIWFRAGGMYADQDPYFSHYFRVGFDGSGLTEFTEANGEHTATWSSDRAFYVDTWSRADAPPVSVLRRTSDQSVVIALDHADVSGLIAQGWTTPEPFVAKGRDGVTDIWGVITRPFNFDPSRSYPVIEFIYTWNTPSVRKDFRTEDFRAMALAELGFIVVRIDGMGHAGRSKAFADVRWKNTKDDGFPDRILWHQAVAKRYPYYDITRVGLIGNSAGGRGAVGGMLFFPEFYDVAVASSGGHDLLLSSIGFEFDLGWPVGPLFAENSNVENAWRLRGKLLLGVGELDTNLHPASTFRLVDALIDAKKDFDFVFVPGGAHGFNTGTYFQHKAWDFFVRHLLGVDPPDRNATGSAGKSGGSDALPGVDPRWQPWP